MKIFVNNSVYTPSTPNNVCPLNYLKQIFARPFPRINLTPTTTKEITEIVKLLKSQTHMVMMKSQPKY